MAALMNKENFAGRTDLCSICFRIHTVIWVNYSAYDVGGFFGSRRLKERHLSSIRKEFAKVLSPMNSM